MKSSIKYLPLKKSHIVPVTDITPDALKKSARNCKRDREDIGYTSVLNATAKALGFEGGFAGYQKEYEEKLVPFLEKHGLKKKADLFSHRIKSDVHTFKEVAPSSFAGRCFCTQHELPQKFFTGYNFDFVTSFDDANYNFNFPVGSEIDDFDFEKLNSIFDDFEKSMENAKANPHVTISSKWPSRHDRTLVDYVLGRVIFDYGWHFLNGLGELFCLPEIDGEYVFTYYTPSSMDEQESITELSLIRVITRELKERLKSTPVGWVELLAYNDRLIFLKGNDGDYDFVFKRMKDENFQHIVCNGEVNVADLPKFDRNYHFKRWLYFEYAGWREMDEHLAEQKYYRDDYLPDYPGQLSILEKYLCSKAALVRHNPVSEYDKSLVEYFFSKKHPTKHKMLLPQFHKVVLGTKVLAISDLVSISDFESFLERTPEYQKKRKGDNWVAVNSDTDKSLPTSVTWTDVLRYIKFFEDVNRVDVRLLGVEEYLNLNGTTFERVAEKPRERRPVVPYDLIWTMPSGEIYEQHPPYCSLEDFDAALCQFAPTLSFEKDEYGLEFCRSYEFAEWTQGGASIRTLNLTDFSGGKHLFRDRPPQGCTGKYKSLKIGFRLCYELGEGGSDEILL